MESVDVDDDVLWFNVHSKAEHESRVWGGNAVLMHTSPESEHFAPDILGHQIGGIKVSRYKPPSGIASQHRSPTCYLHEGPPW